MGTRNFANLMRFDTGTYLSNRVNPKYSTPLVEAAAAGHLEVVRILLANNAKINWEHFSTGRTPLMSACFYGHAEVVEELLQHGASLKGVMDLEMRHPEVMKVLHEHGVTMNPNVKKFTVTDMLEHCNDMKIMRFLLQPDVKIAGKAQAINNILLSSDVKMARLLLDNGACVEMQTECRKTILIEAAGDGHTALVKLLIERGADVNAVCDLGGTALMEAATGGYVEIVKLLLSHNANLKWHDFTDSTALMYACSKGHYEIVEELLKHGANIYERNTNIHTALMEAVTGGHVLVIKMLLEAGAIMHTGSTWFKKYEFYIACAMGDLNMVRYLQIAITNINRQLGIRYMALMFAAIGNQIEVVRLLLDSGARVNMPTFQAPLSLARWDSVMPHPFKPPLTLAASVGNVELVELLLDHGANIEVEDEDGYTALMEAADKGHLDIVTLLLNRGANANTRSTETDETAIQIVAYHGITEIVEILISHGADLEIGESTPLIEASLRGHTDIVRMLIENKANVNTVKEFRASALWHACNNGHREIAEILIDSGADIEYLSNFDGTPLMRACLWGFIDVVEMLIERGADIHKQVGVTALVEASRKGHSDIVALLLDRGANVDAIAQVSN